EGYPVEPPKKRTSINEVPDNYYVSENPEELILNHEYVLETDLNHLIDGYLKFLDDLIPKSRKGQKAKEENEKDKTSRYYQKSAKFKQYKTHAFKNGSRNSDRVESTVNDTNTELPESKFDDLVLDLIDDYLVEEPLVKGEKEVIPESSKASGLEKENEYRNRSSKIELNDADRAEVNSEKTKSIEVVIESQTLPYDQRPVETVEDSHMSGTIEPGFEQRARINDDESIKITDQDRKILKEDKPKPVLYEKDSDRHNLFERINFLIKDLDEDKKNEPKEKRNNCHLTNFEKSLDGLDKILEVESMNRRALVNKENKKKTANENSSQSYLSKNKKETLADLKSNSNEECEWYLKHIKEEKTIFEFNVNPIEDECSKMKNFEGLKDNHPENYGMKFAEETLKPVLKDKIKNDFVSRDQIKRISLEKNVGISLETNVIVAECAG
ncbi:43578_t:CDS:2, partial [Gigaspora margarita]